MADIHPKSIKYARGKTVTAAEFIRNPTQEYRAACGLLDGKKERREADALKSKRQVRKYWLGRGMVRRAERGTAE